jgi:hypothetical protein
VKLLNGYTGKHRKQITTDEIKLTPLCPWCGGFVAFRPACETFEDENQWWIHEHCDKAVQYYCLAAYDNIPNPSCTWSYVHGMNKRNPAWDHNEDRRPTWIPEDQQNYDDEGFLWTAEGVNRRGE